jgi:hypothetical protein
LRRGAVRQPGLRHFAWFFSPAHSLVGVRVFPGGSAVWTGPVISPVLPPVFFSSSSAFHPVISPVRAVLTVSIRYVRRAQKRQTHPDSPGTWRPYRNIPQFIPVACILAHSSNLVASVVHSAVALVSIGYARLAEKRRTHQVREVQSDLTPHPTSLLTQRGYLLLPWPTLQSRYDAPISTKYSPRPHTNTSIHPANYLVTCIAAS